MAGTKIITYKLQGVLMCFPGKNKEFGKINLFYLLFGNKDSFNEILLFVDFFGVPYRPVNRANPSAR
jgi:hypothetical protein